MAQWAYDLVEIVSKHDELLAERWPSSILSEMRNSLSYEEIIERTTFYFLNDNDNKDKVSWAKEVDKHKIKELRELSIDELMEIDFLSWPQTESLLENDKKHKICSDFTIANYIFRRIRVC